MAHEPPTVHTNCESHIWLLAIIVIAADPAPEPAPGFVFFSLDHAGFLNEVQRDVLLLGLQQRIPEEPPFLLSLLCHVLSERLGHRQYRSLFDPGASVQLP